MSVEAYSNVKDTDIDHWNEILLFIVYLLHENLQLLYYEMYIYRLQASMNT